MTSINGSEWKRSMESRLPSPSGLALGGLTGRRLFRMRGTLGVACLVVASSIGSLQGCQSGQGSDLCLAQNTEVSSTGARHVLDVPLPFAPGPMVVLSHGQDGARVSRSSRLWLGDGGTQLYALDGSVVWGLDLGTLELSRVGAVDNQAEQLAGVEKEDTLLVTDSARGSLWVLDQLRPGSPVRIPVGAAPAAVALGPGCRLAYVANAGDWSVSLVDTGVGVLSPAPREVLVAAKDEGAMVVLDGDGRPRGRFDGLPSRIGDLTVVASGRLALASYSELVTTGDIGVLGDGTLVLDEGLVAVDLETGAIERFPLERPTVGPRAGSLAWPTGILDLGDHKIAVALPGWSVVALVDLAPDSPTRGQVFREVPVPGRPGWMTRASLDLDWLYVLDDQSATLTVVDSKGQITRQIPLR